MTKTAPTWYTMQINGRTVHYAAMYTKTVWVWELEDGSLAWQVTYEDTVERTGPSNMAGMTYNKRIAMTRCLHTFKGAEREKVADMYRIA